jgi:hypothetical protein
MKTIFRQVKCRAGLGLGSTEFTEKLYGYVVRVACSLRALAEITGQSL